MVKSVNYKNKFLKYKIKYQKLIKQKGGMDFDIDNTDDISDSVMDAQYSNLRNFTENKLKNKSSRPSSPRPSTPRPSSPRLSSPRPSSPRPSSPRPTSPRPTSPRSSSPLFLISSDDENNDVSPKPTRRINTIKARPIQPSFNRNRRYSFNRTNRTVDSSDVDMEREEMKRNWQPGTDIAATDVFHSVEDMVQYGKIRNDGDLENLD